MPSSNPASVEVRGANSRCQWNGPRRSAGAVCSQKLSGAPRIDVLTAASTRRSAGATTAGSAARKSASCAAGASHTSPLKRLAPGTQAPTGPSSTSRSPACLECVADDARPVAVAVALGLDELIEQQRRHDRRREQLLVRVLQRGARAGADVADERHGGGAAVELRRDAALPHAEDLGERAVREVLELGLVVGRVHDHLVPPGERRVLVGHHAHAPAGAVGLAAGGTQRVHLRRRQRLVAGAEGAGRSRGVSPRGVRRPRSPGRRHDGELAAGRIAAQVAAVRRHRPLPLPLVANSSRP